MSSREALLVWDRERVVLTPTAPSGAGGTMKHLTATFGTFVVVDPICVICSLKFAQNIPAIECGHS